MSEAYPANNQEPLRDEDFMSFLEESETSYRLESQIDKLSQACADIYYGAAAQAEIPLIIPADEAKHDEAFLQLTFDVAVELYDITDQHELTEEMIREAEKVAFATWNNEHVFSQLILQEIADQRYLTVSSDIRQDTHKKHLSALSIGIPVDPEKWLPIINTALQGEPLDPTNPDDFALIETHSQEVLNSPEATQAMQLNQDLTAILAPEHLSPEDGDHAARTAAIEYITSATVVAISSRTDTASLDASVDKIMRECQLTSIDTTPIKQICREFIKTFYA